MAFDGRRVLSLESRRAEETAELIRRNGGDPFIAPSLREVPIEQNTAALEFGERLVNGEFDLLVLTTGIGTRHLAKILAIRYPQDHFIDALRRTATIARGPKPAAALRELGVQATVVVGEPNTWREVLQAIEGRPERRIAVQEYGRPATELIDALGALGAEVTAVPVYRWLMPEDTGPLEEAVRRLASSAFDVTLFTSSVQLEHLLEAAREMDLEDATLSGLRASVIASIGPTTSETLREHGVPPDLEASHPKLGFLVKEAAEQAGELLTAKRS